VVKKATPSMKAGRTRSTPSNQHKVSTSPSRAKSSREEFQNLLLDELQNELLNMEAQGTDLASWHDNSGQVIDKTLAGFETEHADDPEDPTNDYTKKVRQGLPALKAIVAQTTDLEMLAILVDAWDGEEDNGEPEV
jgi:hypothetical protein